MPNEGEINHEKALELAKELSANSAKYRKFYDMPAAVIARAYIDRMEPVEITPVSPFAGWGDCPCGDAPLVRFSYCPGCGKPIKRKDAECRKS